MFRLLRRSQLDTRAYDACVDASPHGMIYGLSWWLDVVSPDWDCLVWFENETYAAVLPVPVRQKYGIRFVHQPLFCQFLGVYGAVSDETAASFLPELVRRYRFVASLSLSYPPMPEVWPSGTVTPFVTHLLSLDRSYEDIRGGYNQNRKRNLQQSLKGNWQRIKGQEIKTLCRVFEENQAEKLKGDMAPDTYPLLEALFSEAEKHRMSDLWYVQQDGKTEAGGWVLRRKGRLVYLFNAATAKGNAEHGRTYLIDFILREEAGSGGIFDFESAPVEKVSGFYASFGSQPSPYYSLRSNRLPGWMTRLWKWKQRLSGLLPVKIFLQVFV